MPIVDVCGLASPWGPFLLVAVEAGLLRSSFVEGESFERALDRLRSAYEEDGVTVRVGGPWVAPFVPRIEAYFIEPCSLSDLPLAREESEFRERLIESLRASVPGRLLTYGELAARCGRSGGARGVAACLRSQPYDLVVPTHRVVTARRDILGPAHVVRWKADLLVHEGIELVTGPTGGLRVVGPRWEEEAAEGA